MTKISTLSDQPFSFSPKNVIFGVKIMKFLIPGQNFGIFASSIKGMDTFLFEMSMKWMFRFKNFRNVYWHGKTHSAMNCQITIVFTTASDLSDLLHVCVRRIFLLKFSPQGGPELLCVVIGNISQEDILDNLPPGNFKDNFQENLDSLLFWHK